MSFPDPKKYAKRTSRSPERKAYTEQWVKNLEEAVMDLKKWKDGRLHLECAYSDWTSQDGPDPERRTQVVEALLSKGYRVTENQQVTDWHGEGPVQGFIVEYP